MGLVKKMILFGMIVSFLSFSSYAQVNRTCTIKSLIGSVKIRKGQSVNWINARPDMQLKEKDAVRTFVESEAELETSEGSILKLGENSTFELSSLSANGDVQNTKVKIMSGTLISNVKKLVNTKSSFEFETPTATAAIRGTVVGFDVNNERTRIKVYEGKVLVTPNGSSSGSELNPNQMATVEKGRKEFKIEKFEDNTTLQNIKKDSTVVSKDTLSGNKTPADSTVKPDSTHLTGQSDSILNKKSMKTDSLDGQVGENDSKKTTVNSKNIEFTVISPRDGQKFTKPMIQVNGTASPGSEVSVMSMRFVVNSSGTFSGQVPIANEEGDVTLEFEASMDGKSLKISRTVFYKPEYRFTLSYPAQGQVINSTSIQVKGEIIPPNAEVSVNGRRLNVAAGGVFAGIVTIPDEEGETQLEFEINSGSMNKTETRVFTYKRPPDTFRPILQGLMPDVSQMSKLTFTIIDRTPDDEITFYSVIDGSTESEKGAPNQPFYLALEQGIHNYTVYAQDKQGNFSSKMSKKIAFLGPSIWNIKMRKPLGNEVLNLPPSTPDDNYKPIYTVEFSVEDLPDDNVNLLREVTVKNTTTGETQTERIFTDNYFTFDMKVALRSENSFSVTALDINNNPKAVSFKIYVR